LMNGIQKIREQAIAILRNLLRKHEFDIRYQNRKVKGFIAGLYLPFVLQCVEHFDVISKMQVAEVQKWLLCFLWILKYQKERILRGWWKKESIKGKIEFLRILQYCLDLFMDRNGSCEVNFIVLDVCIHFIDHSERILSKEDNALSEHVFALVQRMLASQRPLFLMALYSALSVLIGKLRKPLFVHKSNSFCLDLMYEILRHCNSSVAPVREKASKLFYVLLKVNYEELKNISLSRHLASVAESKFIGSEKKKNFESLLNSLREVIHYCKNDFSKEASTTTTKDTDTDTKESAKLSDSMNDSSSLSVTPNATLNNSALSSDFQQQLEEVITRLIDITNYDKTITANWADEEMTANIYIKISNDYMDSPDLRMQWLDNLAIMHAQWGNIEEASQCKIYMAYMVMQYLLHSVPKQLPKQFRESNQNPFARISPNVAQDMDVSDNTFNDETRFQNNFWSLNGFIDFLKGAVTFLKRDRRFELCLEIYNLLSMVYQQDRNYSEMIRWADQYKDICENLVKLTLDGKEVFPRYYRVTFYSKKWLPEEDGKVFIYKKKFRLTIGNVAQTIQKQFASKTHLDPSAIISLPNKDVDVASLDPEKIYFQIVNVKPYLTEEELVHRITPFEQNFDLRHFISEVPFMSDGGKFNEDDVGRQQKRKTIYEITRAFPYLNNRIEVISSSVIILSPIECAIESMQERVNQFRSEVYCTPVRKNNLQALLTGTLATTVHAGPMKFCEVFLVGNEYPEEHQNKLRTLMAELFLLAKAALKINASLIGVEQANFQEMLEEKFRDTMDTFQQKYAMEFQWNKLSSSMQANEKKVRLEAVEFERKLKS